MKSIVSRILLAFVTCSLVVLWYGHRGRNVVTAQQHGPLKATRLYTGGDGLTHWDEVDVKFSPVPGAPATIEQSTPVRVTRSYVVRAAPGTVESWHNTDARRYMIAISGRAEFGIAGGQKVFVEPGRVCLAEDLTGQGHTFRVLGSDEWVALFVDFAQ
ncbi:MAG TPA: hypothetical protein VGG56_15805 [Terracidiphilus sp.]